ncbi:hypothetical protein CTA1_6605 [Colletotrichum tanaceti]|uniref:Uncharacterized protein n=1 Tax=Colletotrichum tanaceti TaxID=1306861 RepID=A0A4U6XEJ3_9PEZI|nr:hypothetical protein CTA1_6605 [Colletotrichum tanaceti]
MQLPRRRFTKRRARSRLIRLLQKGKRRKEEEEGKKERTKTPAHRSRKRETSTTMAYAFDGYSETASRRNRPQPPRGRRQRRRELDEPDDGPDDVYFGTGRFYEENLRSEQQRQRQREQWEQQQQEQQQQQIPRYMPFGPFGEANGLGSGVGRLRTEEEWRRLFVEALRRLRERSRRERAGGGSGLGRQDAAGAGEEIGLEDLLEDLLGWGGDEDGGGGEGGGMDPGGGVGLGGGGGGIRFDDLFGSPDAHPSGGGGFGGQEGAQREGRAGLALVEFIELLAHRLGCGNLYGSVGGPPPRPAERLFDDWRRGW